MQYVSAECSSPRNPRSAQIGTSRRRFAGSYSGVQRMSNYPTYPRLREAFEAGDITKPEFIADSQVFHDGLFTYAEAIHGTEVSQITINRNEVIFTIGPEHIDIIVPPGQPRTAGIETLNFRSYDLRETSVMDVIVDGASVIYDVGGNVGWNAVRWATRLPHVKVHSFEPVPSNYDYLVRNIALNDVQKRVFAHNMGLADRPGELEFWIAPHAATNASMRNVSDAADAIPVRAPVLTLDDFVTQTGDVPDVIKCDVEGAEFLVYQGARETLSTHLPRLHAELLRKWSKPFGYHPTEVIDYLGEFGYKAYAITEAGPAAISAITEETEETNFIFLHPEKHERQLERLALG